MTVSTSVKWAVSSMMGAPTLNGTAGSLIAVLDAFLVNGFGTKSVDSATVTDGICRMGITGGSAAQDHCVIQLAGITGGGATLNGLQRVKTAAAGYVEFPCDLPDGSLTGTITFKIAPLGWEKVFSKTNVAVYRSTDIAGTRAYYRVDDTNALYARVQMYEAMSDVDTGINVAPTNVSGGFYWFKRHAAAATGVYWALVGDSRLFYPLIGPGAASGNDSLGGYGVRGSWAGDISSYRSGDAWSAGLGGGTSTTFSDLTGCIFSNANVAGMALMRQSHGVGGAANCGRFVAGSNATVSGDDGSLGYFPSRADNGLRLSAILLSDGEMAVSGPRGEMPGAYHSPQKGVLLAFANEASLHEGNGDLSGRKLMSIAVGNLAGTANGVAFIDVTGPWRS